MLRAVLDTFGELGFPDDPRKIGRIAGGDLGIPLSTVFPGNQSAYGGARRRAL